MKLQKNIIKFVLLGCCGALHAIPPSAQQNGGPSSPTPAMPSSNIVPTKPAAPFTPQASMPSNGAKPMLKAMTPEPAPMPQPPTPKAPEMNPQPFVSTMAAGEGMKPMAQPESPKASEPKSVVPNEKIQQLVHELTQDVTKMLEEKLLHRIEQVVNEELNKLK